jgi:hypothetical protein
MTWTCSRSSTPPSSPWQLGWIDLMRQLDDDHELRLVMRRRGDAYLAVVPRVSAAAVDVPVAPSAQDDDVA